MKAQWCDLPKEPVERGVRLLTLSVLDESRRAFPRLGDASDRDALHDFRVSLRRLRTLLRVYRSSLDGAVPGGVERRLRDLSHASNESRDLEVSLIILSKFADPSPLERAGIRRLATAGADDLARESAAFRDRAMKEFPDLASTLQERLARYKADLLQERTQPVVGVVAASLAMELCEELRAALDRILSIEHQEEIHRARIVAKRLRYLLDPFADVIPECAAAVTALRRLQTLFGDLHDVNLLFLRVKAALHNANAEEAKELAAVGERISALRSELYSRADNEYVATRAGELQNLVSTAAHALNEYAARS